MAVPIKIFCLSDSHGDIPTTTGGMTWDACLHAGDFCSAAMRGGVGRKLGQFKRWADNFGPPVLAVRGNHDAGAGLQVLATSIKDVTGEIVQVTPSLLVAGLGWTGANFFDLPGEAELQAACNALFDKAQPMILPGNSFVLLTHYPGDFGGLFPFTGDRTGFVFKCVRDLTERLRPLVVIQGHVHGHFMSQGTYEWSLGSTLVVNPGPDGGTLLVNVEEKTVSFVMWT